MGPQYESELNHTNTLRELNRKLPLFMRVKWTECAGAKLESGSRPKFKDFLQFVEKRATLVNNEFGEDLCSSVFKQKDGGRKRDGQRGPLLRARSFATRVYKRQNGKEESSTEGKTGNVRCLVCSGGHRIWKCDKFKKLKCLSEGHYGRRCPKAHFKCQIEGCSKGYNTLLLHPPSPSTASKEDKDEQSQDQEEMNKNNEIAAEINQSDVTVTAATGPGSMCVSVSYLLK